jgi:hypothetical protein
MHYADLSYGLTSSAKIRFSKRGALHEPYNPAFSVNSDFTGPPDIGKTNMARSQKLGRFRLRHGPTTCCRSPLRLGAGLVPHGDEI